MTVEEAREPATEVWPDNMLAVNVFVSMATQWRIGMSGPTGLDYTALAHVMRLLGVQQKERADVFECVRIMEDEALAKMRESRK